MYVQSAVCIPDDGYSEPVRGGALNDTVVWIIRRQGNIVLGPVNDWSRQTVTNTTRQHHLTTFHRRPLDLITVIYRRWLCDRHK